MAQEQLADDQVIDNIIAAAFGNASAGPTAAKAFQHLAAGDPPQLGSNSGPCLHVAHPADRHTPEAISIRDGVRVISQT